MRLRTEVPPENQKVIWFPLIFTLFVGFVFLDPLQRHASRLEWALTIIGVAVFFALYVVALVFWYRRRIALGAIAGVALLGFVFAPFNAGAALFIIYATSLLRMALRLS